MGYSERFLFNSGIKIEHKNNKIHTYDESNDFLFSIGRMPQIISYVPPKMSQPAFRPGMLRTAHITSKRETLCNRSDNYIPRTPRQGLDINVFGRTLAKTHERQGRLQKSLLTL